MALSIHCGLKAKRGYASAWSKTFEAPWCDLAFFLTWRDIPSTLPPVNKDPKRLTESIFQHETSEAH